MSQGRVAALKVNLSANAYFDVGTELPAFPGQTRAKVDEKGVQFTGPIMDQGWGRVTAMNVPGGGELGLYEPRHVTAI